MRLRRDGGGRDGPATDRAGQGSLAEALLPAGAGSTRRLGRIAGLIDWAPMERLLAPLRSPTGRPVSYRRAQILTSSRYG